MGKGRQRETRWGEEGEGRGEERRVGRGGRGAVRGERGGERREVPTPLAK